MFDKCRQVFLLFMFLPGNTTLKMYYFFNEQSFLPE